MTERSFGLFEPDSLLPAQFYRTFGRRLKARGELRLMVAVLEDAVECYRKYAAAQDEEGRRLFQEAAAWVQSRDRRYLFSFENICELLGIDPDCLRAGLQRRWVRRCDPPDAAADSPERVAAAG